MTGEEIKEHVYNAFVCDMFYRPELRDAIYEMVDENAKLREELEAVGTAGYLYGKKQLEEENAKLRMLVSDCIKLIRVYCDSREQWQCNECPMVKDGDNCVATYLMDRAIAFGIEVYE